MFQQNYSKLEQKSDIDSETLEKIAKVMKIPVEAIKNFDENGIIHIISSTLYNNSGSVFYNPTFNPIDKVVELYDKMLADKDEQIALLTLRRLKPAVNKVLSLRDKMRLYKPYFLHLLLKFRQLK